jgi:FkbM family methyltransferase
MTTRIDSGKTWQNPSPATGIGPDHVAWAFRLLLDREPSSNADVADRLLTISTTQALRWDLMKSNEFVIKNPVVFAYACERRTVIALLPDDVRLFVDLSDLEIGVKVARGDFEPSETAFVRKAVRPGQIVVDIGANVGYFSMICADLAGPGGHVYSYEPLGQNFELFERSNRENRFEERVTLRRCAVGASSGMANLVWLPLERRALNSGGAFLKPDGAGVAAGHEVRSVPVVALDAEEFRAPVSFLKIDVEGAELLAFRGAANLLRRDRPTILAEMNPAALRRGSGCNPSEVVGYLARVGYRCRVLEDGRPGPEVAAWPDTEDVLSAVFLPR